MKQEFAETIALQALGWLAQNEDHVSAFIAWSGVSLRDMRDQAEKPEFLAAVIDFVMQEDDRVLEFCASVTLPPERLQQIRAALPGGASEHWT